MSAIRLTQDPDGIVDLEVSDGTLAIGDTQPQQEYLLLASHPGDWKENPALGIGIEDATADDDRNYWRREIVEQLRRIGISIKGVEFEDGSIQIIH